jgi:hypothetical protein
MWIFKGEFLFYNTQVIYFITVCIVYKTDERYVKQEENL